MKKRILAAFLVFIIGSGVFLNRNELNFINTSLENVSSQGSQSTDMSDAQLSSIAMLNYMTVLTQEINSSSNSKVFLDNAYSSIVNNINPNAVDEDSLSQIKILLNTIYAYQSIETKRERLQYIYEQNQANALQHAIPSPLAVLNVVQSGDPIKMVVSVLYMAVDSASSYKSYLSEVDNKYLEDGWDLDDSAAQNLHESRKEAFSYMVEMCNKYKLNGKLALNEKSVTNFVTWENNDNVTRRIDFLEKNQSTYQAYGKYWLVLAESYYEKEEYAKCLSAIETYEGMNIDTFRKDTDFAQTLSIGVAAAKEAYSTQKYIETAEHFNDLILANIEPEHWALRYFVAQSYLDLSAKTTNQRNKKLYLQKAYDLTEENVNYLIDEQQSQNKTYLADVVEVEVKKSDTKSKKKEIKNYNKWVKEARKVELPPVYQPLVLNCDLLFALADEIDISKKDKVKLDEMLHSGDKPLFLVKPIDDLYWFNKQPDSVTPKISFDGKEFEIPASYLDIGSTIKVTVTKDGSDTIYDDWKLDKVDREKSNDVNLFKACLTSKNIKKQDYSEGTAIKLEIIPSEESNYDSLVYKFTTHAGKKMGVINNYTFEMVD